MKRLEIFISSATLTNCQREPLRTFAVFFKNDGQNGAFEELERTETVSHSCTPQFCKSFVVTYDETSPAQTALRVDVYERQTDDTERLAEHTRIAKATITAADLLMAPGNHLTTPLSHPCEERKVGVFTLSGENIDTNNVDNDSHIILDLSSRLLRKKDWNKTALYQRYELRRAHVHVDMEGHTVWLPLHVSDRIAKQRDSNCEIEFSRASMTHRHLCNGHDERRLRIFLYANTHRSSKEALVGSVEFTLRDLCELDPTEEVLKIERVGNDEGDAGHVSILKAEPTDFGSHFSMHVNYVNSQWYTVIKSREKHKSVKKMKRKLSKAKMSFIGSKLLGSGRKKSSSNIEHVSDPKQVDALFSNSTT